MSWEDVKRATVAIAAAEDGIIRGTGFFVSSDGYFLTCAHVVEAAGGWEQVRVQGKSVSLVYLGDSRQDDFAVLQITGYQGEGVPLYLSVTPMHRFLSIGYGRPDFPEGASIDGAITDINPQANFGNLPMLRLAAGHEPFMAGASIRLGENWAERIDQELEQCDYFLLLLSSQSATSEMVTEEVRRARELRDRREEKKPVILPIRVNFPMDSPLNYDLRGYLQRIQQREWHSPDDTQVIVQELLALISQDGGEPWLAPSVETPEPAAPAIASPDFPPLPVAEPELQREPGGAVSLKSGLYVERLPIETDCYQEILQPGSLIRIKAPRQMGKTSLMARILHHAKEQGYHAIPLSLQRADSQLLGNLDHFLRWFCEQVGRRLDWVWK